MINKLPVEMHLPGHNFTGRGNLLHKSKTPLEILINTHQLSRSSSVSSQICYAKHKDTTKRNSIRDKITCWKREMPSKIPQFVNVSIATLTNLPPAPMYNLDSRCSRVRWTMNYTIQFDARLSAMWSKFVLSICLTWMCLPQQGILSFMERIVCKIHINHCFISFI